MTTRRSFLGKLLGLGSALFAASAAVSSVRDDVPADLPAGSHVIKKSWKVGHIAVGMLSPFRAGDWTPLIDGHAVPAEHYVQALNDTEGWYDCYVQPAGAKHPTLTAAGDHFAVTRVHGNVSVIYTGTDPRYTHLKART
jgi:hypothetical protein